MKNTSVKLSALMASLLVSAGVMAADATETPVLKQPLVLDNYTPDARTTENQETYKNTVVPSTVAGPGHTVVGQSNIVNATDGSSTVIGGQNFVADTAKDGNIFGDGSSITGYQSQAGGDNNHLIGEQASSFGMNNQINGNHTHAFGGGNNVTGDQSTATGHYNLITGHNASAFGYDNKALANETTVVGHQSNASGLNASAFGSKATASGESALALGTGANATADSTVAIGNDSNATGKSSVAVGESTNATGVFATALGDSSTATGNRTIAISVDAKAKADESVAIGSASTSEGIRSIAVGANATATNESATVIGAHSTGDIRSTVIGAESEAHNHGFAGGYQAKATGESSTAIGVRANSTGLSTIAIGSDSVANNKASTAIGQGSQADASYSVALGKAATATHGSSVALGTATTTKAAVAVTEATVGKLTYGGFAGTDATAVVSVGKEGDHTRQIVNMGAGEISATSTDAINGSQLYATNDVINNVATTVTSVLGGTAKVDSKGNITMTDIGGTGENTVHDAIKSHTVKINQNAEDIKALEKKLPEVQAGDNTVVTSTTDANGKVTYTVSSKDFQPAIDANTAKIKENADGIKSNAKAITTNTADIRSAEGLIKANAANIAQNTKDIAANTDYIKAVEQKLPVVAAGKNTTVDVVTDANGKVTYTVNSTDFQPAIDKNAKGIADNTKAIGTNTAKIADVEQEAKRHTIVEAGHNMEVTSSKDENGATVYKVATSKDIGVNSLTVYNGPKITKDGIDARNTKIKNVTAGEDDNDAVNVSQLNQVKARQDAQSRALKQVRRTVINHGARLANVENRVTGLENKVDRLDHDVKKNRKRADAGISAVAAMANIPQVYLPGKSGVGVGVGYKHGQSAVAVGYSRSSDNGHHIIKLSAGVDTQKDVTVGAGYMYQW
jgi:putative adhesin